MQGKKKVVKVVVVVAVVAALAGGGYTLWGRSRMQNPMDGHMVMGFSPQPFTETVMSVPIQQTVSTVGTVYFEEELPVYGEDRLRVLDIKVAVGDVVEAGQQLVTYDVESAREDLERQIREAQIQLQNQELNIRRMTLGPTDAEIRNLEANIVNAKEAVERNKDAIIGIEANIVLRHQDIELARTELRRAEEEIETVEEDIAISLRLLTIGAITQEEHNRNADAREVALRAKEERDRALQAQYSQLEELDRQLQAAYRTVESSERDVQTAEQALYDSQLILSTEAEQIEYQQQRNQLELSRMNLQDLRDQLSRVTYETISPLSGIITAVEVSRGTTVETTTELLRVADPNRLIVKADILEFDAPLLELGQSVTMFMDVNPDMIYSGVITWISHAAVTQQAWAGSETVVPIEISVDDANELLRTGFNLESEIMVVNVQNALSISRQALRSDPFAGEHYVFLVNDQRQLERTPVTAGVQTEFRVEILSGLSEGDEIVGNPDDFMYDGMLFEDMGGMYGFGADYSDIGAGEGVPARRGGGGGPAMRVIVN